MKILNNKLRRCDSQGYILVPDDLMPVIDNFIPVLDKFISVPNGYIPVSEKYIQIPNGIIQVPDNYLKVSVSCNLQMLWHQKTWLV